MGSEMCIRDRSRYEGKSIALDEAKILEKPIVVTDYTTVYDSITDGISGSIVEFDEKKLAYSIKGLIENDMLRTVYSNNLKEENKNINYNAERYLELMREGQERAW